MVSVAMVCGEPFCAKFFDHNSISLGETSQSRIAGSKNVNCSKLFENRLLDSVKPLSASRG